MDNYKYKSLKYKNKYLNLLHKIQSGGVVDMTKILRGINEHNKYRISHSPYQIIVNYYKNDQDFIEGFTDSYEQRIAPRQGREYMSKQDRPRDYYVYCIGYNTGRLYRMFERVKHVMTHGYLTGVDGKKTLAFAPAPDEIMTPYIQKAYDVAYQRGVFDYFLNLRIKKDPSIDMEIVQHPLTGEREKDVMSKYNKPRPLRRMNRFITPDLYVDPIEQRIPEHSSSTIRPAEPIIFNAPSIFAMPAASLAAASPPPAASPSAAPMGPAAAAESMFDLSQHSHNRYGLLPMSERTDMVYDIKKVLEYYNEIKPVMVNGNLVPVDLDYVRLASKDNNIITGYLPIISDIIIFRVRNGLEIIH